MRKSWLGLVLFAFALTALAKPAVPTVAQMAAFPKMSSFSLSPDGKHMAALEARGEDRVVLVWRTDALNVAPTVIGTKRMKFQRVSFIKNDLLAVSLWQPSDLRLSDEVTKTFINKLYLTDLQGKEWHEPLVVPAGKSEFEQRVQAISSPTVLDSLPDDPEHILVINNIGLESGDIYKVNTRTFKSERIQRAGEHDAGYLTDRAGSLRARLKTEIDSTGAYVAAEIRNLKNGDWEEHFRSYVKNRDVVEIVGFADDPNIAYVRSNVGKDKSVIFQYDISARKQKDTIFEHKFFDATDIFFNRYKSNGLGDILGLVYEGPRGSDVQWVEPQMEAMDRSLRAAGFLNLKMRPTKFVDPATGEGATVDYDGFSGYTVVSATQDYKTLVIALDGPARPTEYLLLKDGALTALSKTYPDIDAQALSNSQLVYYKARDGLDIPAFLHTPSEALCGKGPWPAVIHPHGGPWARDTLRFDGSMWVPLMVTRCLAVLQPQYRGSDGWGRKLWVAGDAEWGQKMQDDKDDGAKWLIEQGIAKQGRIAMFGFSYGGYAAFAASVRPNGLYKCAIAGAGVSDIGRIWAQFYTNVYFRERQAPSVKGLSPLTKADKIEIPIMIYHGDRDQTVPIEQSEWFAAEAKKSGQRVEYHAIADYAHGPAWTRKINENQLQIIENYLLKGCGGSGL